MPPKKDAAAAAASSDPNAITGFEGREVRMLAAAFVSSIGPDKYDYELMATLTGNTAGSLKKMWPVVKRKAIEAHASFGTFLGSSSTGGEAKAAAPKANGGKKRKAVDEAADTNELDPDASTNQESGTEKKKVAGKGKGKGKGRKNAKKVKTEDKDDSETNKGASEEERNEDQV